MKHQKSILLFIFVIFGLALFACSSQSSSVNNVEPIIVEKIDGTDLNKLILTESAEKRLDIQTTPISETLIEDDVYLVVPYSTIIYDLQGEVWLYVNLAPLTYQREKVVIKTIDGNTVYLIDGPSIGTEVVTIGVAELYGADTGVGK
jgi:hypothetical protein